MTDHYRHARELIDQVDAARLQLRRLHREQPTHQGRQLIGELNQQLGIDLKLAAIHAQLAAVQLAADQGIAR